jgi:hypothetical protein
VCELGALFEIAAATVHWHARRQVNFQKHFKLIWVVQWQITALTSRSHADEGRVAIVTNDEKRKITMMHGS